MDRGTLQVCDTLTCDPLFTQPKAYGFSWGSVGSFKYSTNFWETRFSVLPLSTIRLHSLFLIEQCVLNRFLRCPSSLEDNRILCNTKLTLSSDSSSANSTPLYSSLSFLLFLLFQNCCSSPCKTDVGPMSLPSTAKTFIPNWLGDVSPSRHKFEELSNMPRFWGSMTRSRTKQAKQALNQSIGLMKEATSPTLLQDHV